MSNFDVAQSLSRNGVPLRAGFVAVLAFLFLGESLSGPQWAGVALIAAGAVVLAMN